MINWLINSTLCSGMLLAFYHLVLKNTSLFKFNRIYLLMSLLITFTAPLVVIHQHAASLPSIPALPSFPSVAATPHIKLTSIEQYGVINTINGHNHPLPVKKQINYFLYGILIYGFVAIVLLLRFFRNLYIIYNAASCSEKLREGKTWLVLVDDALVPHTFLNRIFLNKQAYLENSIEQSVIDHEMAHATGYHSLDVIFIALLQAIFWFNPFLFLYRRVVQLNHEFIADAAAIKQTESISGYQQLLLSKISLRPGLSIASQFNYSVTKKRLIMMTKHTSAKTAWAARIVVIPVIAVAFLFFCNHTSGMQPNKDSNTLVHSKQAVPNQRKQLSRDTSFKGPYIKYYSTKEGVTPETITEYQAIIDKYFQSGKKQFVAFNSITLADQNKLDSIYRLMSADQQRQQWLGFMQRGPVFPKNSPSENQLALWRQDPQKYGVWLNDKHINNADLASYRSRDFGHVFISRLTKVAIKNDGFRVQVDLMTNAFYQQYVKKENANKDKSIMFFRLSKGKSARG
jgi:bla regulator protein BlaR1